ncbi:MAG: glycosyltransferase [Prevotellaceae bacterium]|nr:glycosyltransferase [Prevotellaceae bacterium]
MEIPFVSFIIPYYNVPIALLRECVNSIEALTTEKEIIIINDGCDESLEEFSESCIIRKVEHGGQAAARNYGIDIAKGEYIQFVDADDTIITQNYQQIIDIVEKEQPDMFYFHFASHSRQSKDSVSYKAMTGAEFMNRQNIYGVSWNYIFRKSLLGELRFTGGIVHEDEEFTPQLIVSAKKFYFTNSKAYFYRTMPCSTMTNREEEHISKRLNDFLYVMLSLKDKSETQTDLLSCKAITRRTNQLCMDYIYNIVALGRKHELKGRLQDLKENDLYPLPLKFYTWKYYLAAIVSRFVD